MGMRRLYRLFVAIALLSTLLYIRTRIAGLIYNHADADLTADFDVHDSKAVSDSRKDKDPFGNLIKGVLHKLESGQTSDIDRVQYHGVKQDKIVVMGRQTNESAEWVEAELPEYVTLTSTIVTSKVERKKLIISNSWQHAIYSVDDPTQLLHTAMNKGNEANVYLSYIIDHYDSLPSIMAFIHGHHHSWHTDADRYDNGRSLQTLNLDFVRKTGYANLRCQGSPGCPAEIQPWRRDEKKPAEMAYGDAWKALFNETWVPVLVAAPCCAQFAVSREQVLKRSRDEYVWFLKWLMETPLQDEISGRVFEYVWHVMFGRDPVQ